MDFVDEARARLNFRQLAGRVDGCFLQQDLPLVLGEIGEPQGIVASGTQELRNERSLQPAKRIFERGFSDGLTLIS